MQIHIRPFKISDAAELQSAVLESIGHLGLWLDWATPRYSLGMPDAGSMRVVLSGQINPPTAG